MPISVLAYDPEWPRRFEAERTVLEQLLAPWLAGGIHHIGSTAIPGLSAKPIIDMMAAVADLEAARAAISVLERSGGQGPSYRHAPHRPDALWFHKPQSDVHDERTHHLHLTEPDSPLWRERLAFRDALRADPALRDEYQALKLRLADAHGENIKAYTADKRAFVARVLEMQGVALR
jgi:GrpB-like predicted nucleotidyltransferase (UPF0157 family)